MILTTHKHGFRWQRARIRREKMATKYRALFCKLEQFSYFPISILFFFSLRAQIKIQQWRHSLRMRTESKFALRWQKKTRNIFNCVLVVKLRVEVYLKEQFFSLVLMYVLRSTTVLSTMMIDKLMIYFDYIRSELR